ncbi:MAG: LpxL/LpxP family Kdo(2)-lipid IV(A) lauroyl/palmitoleoyl acyltransferase [Pseudomonadota bacterium]
MNHPPAGSLRLFAPRHWPTWLGVALLWCLNQLPFRAQLGAGRALGYLLRAFGGRRKRITRTNIDLCFPELPARERARIVRENFASMGIAILEMGLSWWASDRRLRRLVTIEGLEHLEAALQAGHGAILLSAHFTTMEIGGRLLSLYTPFRVLYREHKNPAMEYVISRGRAGFTRDAIPRDNLLAMRRSLRENVPVWYAPDQDFGIGKGVFVPFFGIPAATITATSTLAKMARSPVVPFYQTRLPGARGYRLTLLPALTDYPGGDEAADASRINALLESLIRAQPAQYLWAHRRFKTRPAGAAPVYD